MNIIKRLTVMATAITLIGVNSINCVSITSGSNYNLVAEAAANPYSKNYNIISSVNYAIRWYNGSNPEYSSINKWAKPNCASFVSECLTAGGINIPKAKKKIIGYSNTQWSVANDQYNYLKKLGYASEKASDSNIHIGDAVYYDWNNNNDNKIDHAAYCIGINSIGKPLIAEHSNNNIRIWDNTNTPRRNVYVVHLTNAVGHIDVTNNYRNKQISIKSLKNSSFVSSDTDNPNAVHTIAIANRSTANSWEKFKVVDNRSITSIAGTTNSVSLKTYTGKYLSAYISDSGAPLKNTDNVSTWEAFRIFKSGNKLYFLSLINGKFVQVRDDNKLYASGEGGFTWEGFGLYTSTTNVNNTKTATKYFPKYTGSSKSIVDGLKSVGADSSYSYRSKIAAVNGVNSYSGAAEQNVALLNKLKNGILIKP